MESLSESVMNHERVAHDIASDIMSDSANDIVRESLTTSSRHRRRIALERLAPIPIPTSRRRGLPREGFTAETLAIADRGAPNFQRGAARSVGVDRDAPPLPARARVLATARASRER